MGERCIEVEQGVITKIVISRPDALNALNRSVLEELSSIFKFIENDDSVRAVVITGAGEKAFVAGADVKAMAGLSEADIKSYINLGQQTLSAIQLNEKPVIAAVNGFALGGGLELALACDFIIASEKAKVGLPEVTLGIIPGFGGTQRLVARAGPGVAKRVALVGDIIPALEAQKLGIIDQVVPAAEFDSAVQQMAQNIAERAPKAITGAKQVINAYAAEVMVAGLTREKAAFMELFKSDDRKEGMTAFIEKRAPNFKGS